MYGWLNFDQKRAGKVFLENDDFDSKLSKANLVFKQTELFKTTCFWETYVFLVGTSTEWMLNIRSIFFKMNNIDA